MAIHDPRPAPRRAAGVAVIAAMACAACAGGRGTLRVRGLDYPVSLSQAVVDAEGNIAVPKPEQIVGHFEADASNWTLLWSLLPLFSGEWDLAPALRQSIEQHGGNAVVNLRLRVSESPIWFVTSWIPVLPTRVGLHAEADIVRL